jgi:tetratricopeptide (TPR) repeat protein
MKRLVISLIAIVILAAVPALAADDVKTIEQRATSAVAAKNWPEAQQNFKQLVALQPGRWEFQKGLAEAESNQGHFQEAVAAFDAAIALAKKSAVGAEADSTAAKAALGAMLAGKGFALLRLQRLPESFSVFEEAAKSDPSPTSYFNLCAVAYNVGAVRDAGMARVVGYCDKAIELNPNKGDAYYIKGSLLLGDAKVVNGKMVAPAGAAEAFNTYLALAPNGAHAAEVKQMLSSIGSEVETTSEPKNRK